MSSFVQPEATLLCTLGGKARVVTLTLDLLLAQGQDIGQVLVVYPAGNPRYRAAYQRLSGEFAGDHYHGRPIRLRNLPLRLEARPLSDAFLPTEVDAVWQSFYHTLAELKAGQQQVHLGLSGGRRVLALVAFSVAMLHFGHNDHVWHIYTPPATLDLLEREDLMHAPPGAEVRLIEVPFTPWATYFPGLRPLLERSPLEARTGLDAEERARCTQVWRGLTPRQRDALRAICATESREQAAQRMGVSVHTLDDHKTAILRACEHVWSTERLDITFLRERFKAFVQLLDEV